MIRALFLAFAQLSDGAVRRVLWLGILGALLLFLAVATGLGWTFAHIGITGIGWLDALIEVLGGVGVLVLAWILFPAVVVSISGLLVDGIVTAVERRHYPGLPPPREQGLGEQAWLALRFFLVVAALNLVALPVYLAMPPLAPFVFYLLNGYLLGREYFEAVAFRRLEPARARLMRRAYGVRLLLGGMAVAFLSTLPLLNLLVPVVGTAFMTHVFHGLKERQRASGSW
ncbi:EI24 domain-containing protein [Arenibaculum pallidiluteum]|uniref:EI24 domain-containing protein n=1 Tax=Arenibaculum pallidiluteum TaxID=2812559 RepID=UPI001A979E88|nr:EI24 domain-containing protein [Arenibaculum pallidiluteum]